MVKMPTRLFRYLKNVNANPRYKSGHLRGAICHRIAGR